MKPILQQQLDEYPAILNQQYGGTMKKHMYRNPYFHIAFTTYSIRFIEGISHKIQPCLTMEGANPYIDLSSISFTIKYYLVEYQSE
jgi:hypothetical protein